MKTVESRIVVAASPADVWGTLVDFESYPAWNPFIVSASGTPAVGERLAIRIRPPEGREMGFKPRVTAAVPGERLEWLGHRETFSGVLIGLLLNERAIRNGFRAMNAAFKQRAEATGSESFQRPDAGVAA